MERQARSFPARKDGFARSAFARVHPRRRRAVPGDSERREQSLRPHPQMEHRRRRHGRQRGARTGQYRSSCRHAGHGREVRALPRIRRSGRRTRVPCHAGYRRDHRHRQEHRAELRRHQPGGHFRAALFRDRAQTQGIVRHTRVPRRSARDGDRAGRRARKRA